MLYSDTELKEISKTALANALKDAKRVGLKPPSKLTLSQWADAYRMLSPEGSAEPGRWITARAEYQREMLDTVSNPQYEHVVFMTAAQCGKTEILLNLLLYYIHQEPAPILFVQPTMQMAGSFSKDRVAPAIRDTKCVTNLVSDAKSRDTNNTILSKSYPGGVVNLVGSNSPSSLASRPVRVVLADEVDRMPLEVSTEGDPLQLAIKRTTTFYNRKVVMVSTPTDKFISRIAARYEGSDQRQYHIKCVHCDDYWVPEWVHVKYEKDENGHALPETAQLHCPHCGGGHNNTQKDAAVSKGKWVARYPERKVAGFHLSSLISPWVKLESLVIDWIAAQKDVALLKTFMNTAMGLPWEDRSDNIDDIEFLDRLEQYTPTSIPKDVALLTAGLDTQDDRIEASVYGFGENNEIWHIDHQVFHGSPANNATWAAVSDYLRTKFKREDGVILPVSSAIVDSGGHHTQTVYAFCKANAQRRWWAGKGRSGSIPIFPSRASYTKNDGKVYILGVDSAKEYIYTLLKNTKPGSSYVHFPESCDGEFFSQLSAEKKTLTYRQGYSYYVWKKDPARRNEILDCFVYALAAKEGLNPSIKSIKRRYIEKYKLEQPAADKEVAVKPEEVQEQPPEKPQEQHQLNPNAVPLYAVPPQKTPQKQPETTTTIQRKLPRWKQNLLNKQARLR